MNYLAHLFLSGEEEDIIIGNFAGDFVRIREIPSLPTRIQQGIDLHRMIDTYTDAHPQFRKGVLRLRESHGKYAAVILDILYDFILASKWEQYTDLSLDVFAKNMYTMFRARREHLPVKLKSRIDSMIDHEFIQSYAIKERVQFVLTKMDERTKFPSHFYSAMNDFEANQGLFEKEFESFMGDMIRESNEYIQNLPLKVEG